VGAQELCHVVPPSLLRHTFTLDVSALLTLEWKTKDSPTQLMAEAHVIAKGCAFDHPGVPSSALDHGRTVDVHDAPPSSVRMTTLR
jgi:hypothetical protein